MVNLGGVEKVGDNDQNEMYKILKELVKANKESIHKIGSSMLRILNASSFSCAEPTFAGNGPLLILCTQTHIHTPHTQTVRQIMA